MKTSFLKKDDTLRTFRQSIQNQRCFDQKGYLSYLLVGFRQNSIFRLYTKLLLAIRRISFIRITLKILLFLVSLLRTSALFLLSASLFLISFPIVLPLAFSSMLLTAIFSKQINKENLFRIGEKQITIFFPNDRAALENHSFFCGMVMEEVSRQNVFCIVVSPYYWSTKGLYNRKGKPYLASRFEENGILLIRRHYYFHLKKKIFPNLPNDITEIY